MSKTSVADFDTAVANNTDVNAVGIQGSDTISSGDNALRSYAALLARFYDSLGAVNTVGGTASAITVTITEDWTAYATGMVLAIKAASASTGATTLNVTPSVQSALGVKAIRRQGDAALQANDMVANGIYLLRYDAAYNSAAGAWVLMNPAGSGGLTSADLGKESIWVPAGAMNPRTTNGAARGSTEMSTNKNMVVTLDFDASTQEFAQFSIRMPKSWNESTVTFIPVWSHASTTTNFGVVWGLDAVAISDDDTMDVAFGTAQTSSDTGGTTNDSYQGPESSAITIAGTPAVGDLVMYRIHRDPSDGNDTMAIDARLHGVLLLYTVDALSDT